MDSQLYAVVSDMAGVYQAMSDEQIGRSWAWGDYESEGVRFAGLVAYGYLRELAALLGHERTPSTIAQRILAQYHAAYRDLQAVLIGCDDTFAEQVPAEGEWPLREVVSHIVEADATFLVVVSANLAKHRDGSWNGEPVTNEEYEQILGPEDDVMAILAGSLSSLKAYHATIHARVLQELALITDPETLLPARFWESQIYQLRFRLQRFDAHIRQHTIQIEKTQAALGQPPSEGMRLARLLYGALADAEGQLIGAANIGTIARTEAAGAINELTAQIRAG